MRPPQRRDVGEKMVGRVQPFTTPGLDGMAEVQGVLIHDGGGE